MDSSFRNLLFNSETMILLPIFLHLFRFIVRDWSCFTNVCANLLGFLRFSLVTQTKPQATWQAYTSLIAYFLLCGFQGADSGQTLKTIQVLKKIGHSFRWQVQLLTLASRPSLHLLTLADLPSAWYSFRLPSTISASPLPWLPLSFTHTCESALAFLWLHLTYSHMLCFHLGSPAVSLLHSFLRFHSTSPIDLGFQL